MEFTDHWSDLTMGRRLWRVFLWLIEFAQVSFTVGMLVPVPIWARILLVILVVYLFNRLVNRSRHRAYELLWILPLANFLVVFALASHMTLAKSAFEFFLVNFIFLGLFILAKIKGITIRFRHILAFPFLIFGISLALGQNVDVDECRVVLDERGVIPLIVTPIDNNRSIFPRRLAYDENNETLFISLNDQSAKRSYSLASFSLKQKKILRHHPGKVSNHIVYREDPGILYAIVKLPGGDKGRLFQEIWEIGGDTFEVRNKVTISDADESNPVFMVVQDEKRLLIFGEDGNVFTYDMIRHEIMERRHLDLPFYEAAIYGDRLFSTLEFGMLFPIATGGRGIVSLGLNDLKLRASHRNLTGYFDMDIIPETGMLIANRFYGKNVDVYRLPRLSLIKSVKVARGLRTLKYDKTRRMLYTGAYFSGIMYAVDPEKEKVLGESHIGKGIMDFLITEGGRVFATSTCGVFEIIPEEAFNIGGKDEFSKF